MAPCHNMDHLFNPPIRGIPRLTKNSEPTAHKILPPIAPKRRSYGY